MSDIEIIETTDGSEFEVEVFEAVPIIPDEVPHLDHNKLNNREISDQHPMSAITGLEKEIEDIKALKTVESNKIGVANYYEWDGGAAYDTFGYFVSLVTHNSTIKICDGGDIFGVTVGDAAFVGGQNQDVPRDNKYALVVTSGPVDVRCESDVEEGDYVICNGRGEAKKTTTECGYKVIAINLEKTNQYGTTYATIALGVQACTTDSLGKDLQALASRVGVNEQNIVLAINVSNQAYNKATEVVISNQTISEKVDTAVGKVDEMSTTVENMGDQVSKAQGDSARARAIAETAALSATAIKDEAIARANDAWAKADKVETEAYSLCAKIDKYSVGEYSQAYGLTFEQAQGILKPGMIYVPTKHIGQTVYHTETYSYTNNAEKWSEEEKDINKVYYNSDTKKYWWYQSGDWKSSDTMPQYTRIFTPDYLYQWGWLPAYQKYGWITIDKTHQLVNYESVAETNLAHKAVYFAHIEPTVAVGDDFGYWYTDGATITAKDDDTDKYEPYTLYKWETDHWVAVATLKGNASNRMISEVYQTTNEIMMGVINPRGGIAGFDAKLTDTESEVTTLSGWKNGENQTAEAIIKQKTDENGASIVISALQKEDETISSIASLVLNVAKDANGEPTSNLVMSADNINFEADNYSIDASKILLGGETTFTTTEKDEDNNDVTKIHGSHIATGTIDADKIATDAIRSKNYKSVDGNDNPTAPTGTPPYSTDGTFLDLSNGALYSKKFAIDSSGNAHYAGFLNASQITTGILKNEGYSYEKGNTYATSGTAINLGDGSIRSKNFAIDSDGNGHIGGWDITEDGIEKKDGDNSLVGMLSTMDPCRSDTTSPPRFYAGARTDLSDEYKDYWGDYANFLVLENGTLYADNVHISGLITATDGSFAGQVQAKAGSSFGSFTVYEDSIVGNTTNENEQNIQLIDKSTTIKTPKLCTDIISTYDNAKSCISFSTDGTGNQTLEVTAEIYKSVTQEDPDVLTLVLAVSVSEVATRDIPFVANLKYHYEDSFEYNKTDIFDLTIPSGRTFALIRFKKKKEFTAFLAKRDFDYMGLDLVGEGITWSTTSRNTVDEVVIGNVQQNASSILQVNINGNLVPAKSSNGTAYNLGSDSDGGYWNTIYCRTSAIDLSDRQVKKNIERLSDPYEQIFDALEPVSYKFKVSNNNRTHAGFIAQDVKAAVENAGLTTQDFAAYCEWQKDDGTIGCGLRYSEFIALCVNEIQKLKKRVNELEEKLNTTK